MKSINLSWNGFGLEGAIALGEALKVNNVLEEIDVSSNRINTEGAVCLAKGRKKLLFVVTFSVFFVSQFFLLQKE